MIRDVTSAGESIVRLANATPQRVSANFRRTQSSSIRYTRLSAMYTLGTFMPNLADIW